MTFQPDSSQLKALKTWYPVDNPLHFNPRHAVIKLAGEVGEILDLFGKHEYKPNFSWWNCKKCSCSFEQHQTAFENGKASPYACKDYTPLILDELGDYSYYLRILSYQKEVSFEELYNQSKPSLRIINMYDLLYWLSQLSKGSNEVLDEWVNEDTLSISRLSDCAYRFQCVLSKLNTTLEQVLDLNYKKLNSEPTNHGWKNARMKTIADCPPMNPK